MGATAVASRARATPTPATGAAARSLRLGAEDSGKAFTVSTGTHIQVDLASDAAGSYDPPEADDAAVLRRDDHHGGYPDGTDATADFTVVGHGSAHISSQTDVACLHSTPACRPPQRGFQVTIVVG